MAGEALFAVLRECRYEYVRRVGAGSSATCHVVRSLVYGDEFVCKVMPLPRNKVFHTCELNALTHLNHPNIIRLYGFKKTADSLYLFLEFCPGGSLHDLVLSGRRIPKRHLYVMCKGVVDGLAYVHSRRFAHLDLKPANILIDRFGRAKLADFGFSKDCAGYRSNRFAGTPAFMAPELRAGRWYEPFKADIWSLGVTFYFIACRQLPPSDTTSMVGTEGSSLDAEFNEVLVRMMSSDPACRPTAEDVAATPIFRQAAPRVARLGGSATPEARPYDERLAPTGAQTEASLLLPQARALRALTVVVPRPVVRGLRTGRVRIPGPSFLSRPFESK